MIILGFVFTYSFRLTRVRGLHQSFYMFIGNDKIEIMIQHCEDSVPGFCGLKRPSHVKDG